MNSIAIIISFYAARTTDYLFQLMKMLEPFKRQCSIVINTPQLRKETKIHQFSDWEVIFAPNHGMNIGAWQQGFLAKPDRDFYFFFQDECFIKREGFFAACIQRFKENPRLGMLGESLNFKWNQPWHELQNSHLNWCDDDHQINGKRIPRVDFYLMSLQKRCIDPGDSALHLRSLCWAFRGQTLRSIGGFPYGASKGDCIAAEIGVSKQVLQVGYTFDQVAPSPFYYVGHREWKADGNSKH